jgi:hypothetical protein
MLAIGTWVIASSSQQVEQLTNPMAVPRTGHAATALSDGRILITGGHDSAGNLVAVSEIFDPATGNSTASATLTTARVNHTATLLADGRVLVAGGTGASGALSSAEIFDPANASAGFQAVGSMTAARTGHTATLLNNGSVLVAGGEATGTAEIFDPATSTFTATTGNLTVARSGHTATLFTDDSVLLAGGNVNSMETFTATDQKFTLDLAAMSVVRTGHWALELSGGTRLLLFQGDTGNSIDEFSNGAVTPKGSLDFHASSATLLANGKILVLGSGVAGLYDPDAVPPASDFTAFDETSLPGSSSLVPGSSSLQRSGQSATQLSGDKKIYVAGGVGAQNLFQGAALFNPARIWTDKDDYFPDDPVILSGSGWKANEAIYLYAVDNETEAWTYESTVAADANGGFVVSPYFIVELRHLGVQFHVTALGAQSTMQADVKFTDANIGTVTVTPSPAPTSGHVSPGGTASYLVTVNFGGNTTTCNTTLSVTGLPAGAAANWNGTGLATVTLQGASNNTPKTANLQITTTGATPLGTHTITVNASTGTGCTGSPGSGTGTLVVFGAADHLAFLQGPTNANAGASISPAVTVRVLDSGNRLVANSSASISMAILNNPGSGTLSGTTSVNAVNGTATFSNLSIDKVGTGYTLRATSSVTGVTSGPFNITVGAATQVLVETADNGSGTVVPAQIVNGGSSLTVYSISRDAFGNFVDNVAASWSLVNLTGGVVASDLNPAGNGKSAVFTPNNPGSAAIHASVAGLTSTDSGTITVNVGALHHFNVEAAGGGNIGTQTAGTPFNIKITALDASDNLATSFTGSSAKVVLTSTGTLVAVAGFPINPTNAFSGGVLDNYSVKITNTGNFTITATQSGGGGSPPQGTSNPPFTVNAGAAASITATAGTPQSATINTAFATNLGATVKDTFGNLVPNVTVTFMAPASGASGTFAGGVNTATTNASGVATAATFTANGTAGLYNVTASSGAATTASFSLTNNNPAPTLASIAPDHGTAGGTLDVVFTGSGYIDGVTSVNFGADITATVTVTDSQHLTAHITIGALAALGPRNVSVINSTPGGGTATLTNGFTVNPACTAAGGSISPAGTVSTTYGDGNIAFTATPTGSPTPSVRWQVNTGSGFNYFVPDETGPTLTIVKPTVAMSGYQYRAEFTNTCNGTQTAYSNVATLTVARADATVVVTPYDVTYDCNSYTATVTSIDGKYGESGNTVGTVDVSNTTHTPAGTYSSDSWSFTGTANYNNIPATTITDEIDKADTLSTVTSSKNPSTIGENVTFTATVKRKPFLAGCTPTGSVTFMDGSTPLGAAVALSGGSATFSTPSLSAGHHIIKAVYSGDDNFNATDVNDGTQFVTVDQWVQYKFNGFFSPVDNPTIWNTVKAGQTIPVKWQLTDINNTIICDLTTLLPLPPSPPPNGLTSIQVQCPTGPTVTFDPIEEVLANAGQTVFRCDGTQFIYNWQTSKSWAGTCRVMTVRLADGTTHTANFSFTR